jgi:basic amino acid/polyamine antiporter, APA family
MDAKTRDAGLVRAVGTWGLAAGLVNIIVGSAIFAVPSSLAAAIGAYAPLALIACALVVGAVALCFAEGGRRIASSGGVYGYVDAAFGALPAYVAGTLLWVSDVLACGGVAAAFADNAVAVLPESSRAVAHALIIIAVIGGIAFVNIGGVARGVSLIKVTTLVKLLPLALFVIVGIGAIHGGNFSVPGHADAASLGRAMILATFAFMGMEGVLAASGEVARPERTIPRALAMAIGFVTLLYVAIQIVAQGILGPDLAHSRAPLPAAMARISPLLSTLMLGGAAVSMFGWLSADILASPRVLFAFARDGMLPAMLGRVHPRSHAPHVAIVCYAVLAAVLALTGTFAELAVLATLASAPLYIVGCLAAWMLQRRDGLPGTPSSRARWLSAAMMIAVAGMLVLIALASRAELTGLALIILVSALVYLIQQRATRVFGRQ